VPAFAEWCALMQPEDSEIHSLDSPAGPRRSPRETRA